MSVADEAGSLQSFVVAHKSFTDRKEKYSPSEIAPSFYSYLNKLIEVEGGHNPHSATLTALREHRKKCEAQAKKHGHIHLTSHDAGVYMDYLMLDAMKSPKFEEHVSRISEKLVTACNSNSAWANDLVECPTARSAMTLRLVEVKSTLSLS